MPGYNSIIRACIANIIEELGIPIDLSRESSHAIETKRFVKKVPLSRATCPETETSILYLSQHSQLLFS